MRFSYFLALTIASAIAGWLLPAIAGAPIVYFTIVIVGTTWIVLKKYGRPSLISPYQYCGWCCQRRGIVNRVLHADAFCSHRCEKEMNLFLESRAIAAVKGVWPDEPRESRWRTRTPTEPYGNKAVGYWRRLLRDGGEWIPSEERQKELEKLRAKREARGIMLPNEYRGAK